MDSWAVVLGLGAFYVEGTANHEPLDLRWLMRVRTSSAVFCFCLPPSGEVWEDVQEAEGQPVC